LTNYKNEEYILLNPESGAAHCTRSGTWGVATGGPCGPAHLLDETRRRRPASLHFPREKHASTVVKSKGRRTSRPWGRAKRTVLWPTYKWHDSSFSSIFDRWCFDNRPQKL